jgi:hypothetical protein
MGIAGAPSILRALIFWSAWRYQERTWRRHKSEAEVAPFGAKAREVGRGTVEESMSSHVDFT